MKRDANKRTHNQTILKSKRKKVKNIKQEEFNDTLVLKNFENEKELNESLEIKTPGKLQNLPWDDGDIVIAEKASILIVDDNESIRRTMSMILEKKCNTIDTAKTGEEAIEKAQERYFNIAILDIKLPDIEGVELIKPLKKVNPDIEIIVATGYASLETSMKALNEGAAYYIIKPINMDEMLLTIDRSLEKQKLKIDNRRLLKEVQKELDERKKVEKKILIEKNKLKKMFESLEDIVYTISEDFKIEYMNPSAKKDFGDNIGEYCYKLFHKRETKCPNCDMDGTLKEKILKREWKPSQKNKIYDAIITPLKNSDGTISRLEIDRDVTEKAETEKALKKSEEKYQKVVENANDGIAILQDGSVKFANNRALEMTNYKLNKIIDKSFIDLVHPKSRKLVINRYKKRLEGKKLPSIYEIKILKSDGNSLDVELNVTIIEYENRPAHMIYIRDLSERNKANQEIQSLAKFPEENQNPVYRVSKEGVLLYANSASRKLILTDQTKIGDKIPEKWIDMIKNLYDSKKRQTIELKFGEKFYLFDQVPIHDKDYVNVYAMDITMNKKVQKQLIESEEKYRTIVDNINDALIIHDFNWKILDVNENTENLLNFKRDELIGKKLDKIRIKENSDIYDIRIKKIMKSEKLIFDNYLLNKDRKQIPVSISSKLVTKKGNGIIQTFARDITDRKQSEQEMEKAYASIETSLSATFTSDFEGRLTYANRSAARMWGFESPADMIGTDIMDYWTEKSQKKAKEIVDTLIKEGSYFGEGLIGKSKDGLEFVVEANSVIIKDSSGKPLGMTGSFTDITERKRAENDLKESEQKMKNIIDHSNELFFIHDIEHNLNFTSIQSQEIFGYTPEEMKVKWITLLTDNPMNEIGFKITEKAIKTGKKQKPYILEAKRKDGKLILVEIDESPIKDENGKVVEFTGALRDVTKQRKAQLDVLTLKEYNEKILQSVKSGIVVTDKNLKVITWNDFMEESLKIKKNGIIGKNIKKVIIKFKTKKFEKIFKNIVEKGKIYNEFAVKIKTKNGIKFFNLTFSPRKDEKNNIIGIVMSWEDATESIKMGEKLSTIYELTNKMILKSNENDILELGLDAIEKELKFKNCSFVFLDENENELYTKAYRGFSKKIKKLRTSIYNDFGLVNHVFKTGKMLNISDVSKNRKYLQVDNKIKSELVLPLKTENIIIGVLNIESEKQNAFSSEDEELLKTLISEISTALINLKLQDETRKKANALAMLNNVGKVISSPLKLNDLYQTIYEQTTKLLNTVNFYITLYQKKKIFDKTKGDFKEEEYLEFAYEIEGNQRIKKRSRKLRNGLTEYVIKTRKALLIKNNFKKTCKNLGISPLGRTAKTWLGVPLISKGIVIGVITIQDYEKENAYDCENKDLISNIADQAAVAIENSKLYEELKQNYEKLQELDILKSDFLRVTSHEFGTPITILKGNIDMFLQGTLGELSDLQLNRINSLNNSVDRLEKMRTQTLFLSKVDSGDFQLKKEHFLLNEIIEKVVNSIRIIAENNNQYIKTNLIETRIFADVDKVTEIFENLLSNAIKYAGKGTLIEIDSKENKDDIQIIVKDNGEGIGKKYLKKTFERFERAHGSMHHKQGTGLGLAIVKEIIESHGGKIWCESEKGKGSAFHITIPKK